MHAAITTSRHPALSARHNGTPAWFAGVKFCLIPTPTSELRFAEVNIVDRRFHPLAAEFLVYLMEGRTCAEVLRALPAAVRACHVQAQFALELFVYFQRLAEMLKYNAPSFVIEPAARPDRPGSWSGILPADQPTDAAAKTRVLHMPPDFELPELPEHYNQLLEPTTVLAEIATTRTGIPAA